MKSRSDNCPICGRASDTRLSPALYKCGRCSLVFNVNCKSLSYDRDYFIADYQQQYGKTYIEDFENIYRFSNARLDKILEMVRPSDGGLAILDIGSAAGFFLKAAKDRGMEKLLGIEISGFASDYCRNNFSIDVIKSPFEEAAITGKFDIITSWFFIEHLMDPLKAMERIYGLLNDGGVFALGVPSYFGPAFYLSRNQWINTRPADHRIDMSPAGARKILKDIGFKKVKVTRCGYHPERVVSRENILFRPFELLYRIYTSLTGFSDTIEIYAVK